MIYLEINNKIVKNDYSKDNLTQKSIISGICFNDKCNNIFLSNLRLLFRHNFTCSDCIKIKQKEKTIKTCLEKYGVINPKQNKEVMNKIKKICLEKYGCETVLGNKSIREKTIKTCLEKYDCEYAMQNDNIASKSSKKYTLPSGKIINIQGYENYALDKMFKDNIKEGDIYFIKKEVPIIWYEENNKKHRHYVDFFIKTLNKCIKVKSIWTFEKKKK